MFAFPNLPPSDSWLANTLTCTQSSHITDPYIFLHRMLFHFTDASDFMPHAFFTQFERVSNNTNYWILLNCIILTQFYGFP